MLPRTAPMPDSGYGRRKQMKEQSSRVRAMFGIHITTQDPERPPRPGLTAVAQA